MTRTLMAFALLVSLAGCASVPPPAPPAPAAVPASPPHSGPVGATASGGSITVNAPPAVPGAVVDSTPSPEALVVLGTIPEPLGSKTRPDTTLVPVPAETQPLGDRAGAGAVPTIPDAPPAGPPAGPAVGGAAAPVAPGAAATSDSCWRVQVGAPPEKDRAERLAAAAYSQLMARFDIEPEGGLYKVRSRGCLTAAAAQDLKNRAIAVGFDDAFRMLKPRR